MDHSLRPYWVYSLGDIDVLVDLIGLTLILIVKELLYSSAEGRPGGRPGGPEDFSLVTLKYPWSSLYCIIVTPLIGSCNFNDLPHRVAMCKYQYQNLRQWYNFTAFCLIPHEKAFFMYVNNYRKLSSSAKILIVLNSFKIVFTLVFLTCFRVRFEFFSNKSFTPKSPQVVSLLSDGGRTMLFEAQIKL